MNTTPAPGGTGVSPVHPRKPKRQTINLPRLRWDAARRARTGGTYARIVPNFTPGMDLKTHYHLNTARAERGGIVALAHGPAAQPGPLVRIIVEGVRQPLFGYLIPTGSDRPGPVIMDPDAVINHACDELDMLREQVVGADTVARSVKLAVAAIARVLVRHRRMSLKAVAQLLEVPVWSIQEALQYLDDGLLDTVASHHDFTTAAQLVATIEHCIGLGYHDPEEAAA